MYLQMELLKYDYYDNIKTLNINYRTICNSIEFYNIPWYNIETIVCYSLSVTKKIYKFILSLQNLKRLRFRNNHGLLCLITYNTKFFKHKLLLMGCNACLHLDINTRIIFIL